MALVPGSIAFTGFNADGNDSLAFAALAAIPGGTTIFFSDREWTGSAFNSGEGGWSWTAPATDVAPGTVITISDISDQDGCASLGESSRDRLAEPLRCAGHDGASSRQRQQFCDVPLRDVGDGHSVILVLHSFVGPADVAAA